MSDADGAVRAVWVAAGLVLAAFLVWRLADLLLLAFGAALLATLFRVLADFIERHTPLPRKAAYGASLVLVLAVIGAAAWLLGAQVSAQVSTVTERLPASLNALEAWLREQGWLSPLMDELTARTAGMASRIGSLALTGLDVVVALLLVLFGGIYFGAEPRLYRHGLVHLFPRHDRARVTQALDLSAYAMRRWLLSQFVDMVVVGALTGIGLWLVGVPSPLALGLLTALAAFIPYVGAIIAGAVAVVIAFGERPELALWALGVYAVVQQVEGHLILPFVQRWAIAVPPALALFAVVAMGTIFGPLGIFFAAPLAVVLYVLVRELYVR
jgi:predicted PurR-regulated permease PerM